MTQPRVSEGSDETLFANAADPPIEPSEWSRRHTPVRSGIPGGNGNLGATKTAWPELACIS